MVNPSDTGPLDWRIGIVDKTGRPTPEFQRRWNAQRGNNSLIGLINTGTGAPTGVPADGQAYVDTSTDPYTFYIGFNGAWSIVGASEFIQLADVPNSYSGAGNKLVQVNSGATGLEFTPLSAILDLLGGTQGDVLYRSSSGWTVLAPGTSGQVLQTNGTGANPTWVTPTGGGGSSFSVPDITTMTWVNQGTSTAIQTVSGGSVLMDIETSGSLNWRGLFQNAPSAPYKVRTQLRMMSDHQDAQDVGAYFYDGTKLLGFEGLILISGPDVLRIERINSVNSDNSTVFSYGVANRQNELHPLTGTTWLQLRNDGTTLFFDASQDGINFFNLYSESVGTFLTPTQVGFGGISVATTTNVRSWILNFVVMNNANLN